jgi:hypothetical protein
MATTTKKSPSKAKTKTAKASTATKKRSVKKTTVSKAAKTTKATKSVEAKAPAKKTPPAADSSKIGVTIGTLRRMHTVAVVLFVALAGLAGFMMSSVTSQLTLGYLAKDEIASKTSTVLVPAVQSVYDIELRWAVVGILVISAIMPLLYVTRLKNRYADFMATSRMLPHRWVDMAITGALMTELIALVSGISDIATLKLIGGSVVATAVLGLIAERQNNVSQKPVHSAYYASLFTGLLPWAVIATYAVSTVVYGDASAPWHLYALYAVGLFGFLLSARNQHMQFGKGNYLIVERNYVAISMLTKAAFAVMLIVGLAR